MGKAYYLTEKKELGQLGKESRIACRRGSSPEKKMGKPHRAPLQTDPHQGGKPTPMMRFLTPRRANSGKKGGTCWAGTRSLFRKGRRGEEACISTSMKEGKGSPLDGSVKPSPTKGTYQKTARPRGVLKRARGRGEHPHRRDQKML